MPLMPRRTQPAARIAITEPDPAAEVVRMRRLVGELNRSVEDLWLQVRPLRIQMALADGRPVRDSYVDEWPPVRPLPREAADPEQEVTTLGVLFDDLNRVAESLWIEVQWLRAQLAAREEAPI